MKNFFNLLALCLLFASCSQSELEPITSREYNPDKNIVSAIERTDSLYSKEGLFQRKQRIAVSLLIKDLRLDGTRYVLDVTEEEAEARGIEPEVFKSLVSQLESENEGIEKAIREGQNVKLIDPQRQMAQYNDEQSFQRSRSIMKAGVQYALSWRITTVGQEQGTASFKTTNNTTYVRFGCGTTGGALVITYVCSVTTGGSTNSESRLSTPFCVPVMEIPVSLSGSGVIAKLTFQTSNPGGGYCVWNAN